MTAGAGGQVRRDRSRGAAPLAVTMGDPAGIGLDIVLGAWAARHRSPLPAFVLYTDRRALEARARLLGLSVVIGDDQGQVRVNEALAIVDVAVPAPVKPGAPDVRNAGGVIEAIDRAVSAVVAGTAAGVVTNPIAKSVLYEAGFKHPGHTEYLAELAGRHFPGQRWVPVMMLASDALRVVPMTIHIPLADVASRITGSLIDETVRITARDLTKRFGIAKPRLVVAGLNPHAGENGSLGREDLDIIAPAVARLQADGFDIKGPLSADTLFHEAQRQRYDAAICMYHDQALIPIKTLSFHDGVNVTLGLPFVRTSPDHGTAFDIAGSGKAQCDSFVAALKLAARLCAHGDVTAQTRP